MATRQIIVLDQLSADPPQYRFLLRADVPVVRQPLYANTNYVSTFVPLSPDTDPDLPALKSGAVTEKPDTLLMQPGVAIAAVRAELIARQAAYQTAVTAEPKWTRYGTFWNGTAWTAAGV